MISRRDLLKLAGLSTIAYTAGVQFGKFITSSHSAGFHLTAFLPDDEVYLNYIYYKVLEKVKKHIPDAIFEKLTQRRFEINNEDGSLISHNEKIDIVLQRNDFPFNCDIFFKDNLNSIYTPDELSDLFFIRDDIKNKKAKVKFICSFYPERNSQKSLGYSRKIVIEIGNKIWNEIPIKSNYHNIEVKGSIGLVNVMIEDGSVFIKNSSCRNKLCIHQGKINYGGESLICAPNKVLIRVYET